ncbi:transketolase family protein [Persicitalea jodogahamensis]|uniref:1-deoxy-D-xylulose-5-phosphate synthase n=1 Tax=Persicitalea jodogahamensis TaxID=402147 RepID=A0A8J3D6H9_9BACT|nr:transketolase [Persicitalea jodogahamensis]GHB81371.1 1-deoxy-D-xylulose-5-phosphate synthase [Persicitalea jodogahamensis]
MRVEFSQSIEKLAAEDESIVFITGDLGYNAFENLRETLGKRFINAGVAEQNMVGVAAGMAYKGYKVFCYSIAPFIVYRCLEQFRNDVCFHNLPVFLVANGGGYGYGIMGSSHHTLEDLACLSGLQNVTSYVPAFSDEIDTIVKNISSTARPAYLRLGAGKLTPENSHQSGSFNIVHHSEGAETAVVTLGPITNNALMAVTGNEDLSRHVTVLAANTFPLTMPEDVRKILHNCSQIVIAEEHVSTGGLAQQLSVQLLENGIRPETFVSLRAEGYPDHKYGSQQFHQKNAHLDAESIETVLLNLPQRV